MTEKIYLKTENLCKSFGHIQALDGMNFTAYQGEVTAIVGDNGSGKSTLANIFNGSLQPNSGQIIIQGKSYDKLNIKTASKLGIHTVYQDLSLDNYKNSVENIFLGNELTVARFFLQKKLMHEKAEELLNKLKINISDLTVPVAYLSGGQRQAIAIARALNSHSKLLILDEPTAAMGIKEASKTVELLKNLKTTTPLTQIIISHNLFQAFELADRICVVRAGKIIAETKTADSSPKEIHNFILEKEMEAEYEFQA